MKTYKIVGSSRSISHYSKIIRYLSTCQYINISSIKGHSPIYCDIKFKIKAPEQEIREIVSQLSYEYDFMIMKIKRVLF